MNMKNIRNDFAVWADNKDIPQSVRNMLYSAYLEGMIQGLKFANKIVRAKARV